MRNPECDVQGAERSTVQLTVYGDEASNLFKVTIILFYEISRAARANQSHGLFGRTICLTVQTRTVAILNDSQIVVPLDHCTVKMTRYFIGARGPRQLFH